VDGKIQHRPSSVGVGRLDGTQVIVDDVPPGTYHVRVRAINEVGTGAASSELAVVVSP
jgi:hypothetical protein